MKTEAGKMEAQGRLLANHQRNIKASTNRQISICPFIYLDVEVQYVVIEKADVEEQCSQIHRNLFENIGYVRCGNVNEFPIRTSNTK